MGFGKEAQESEVSIMAARLVKGLAESLKGERAAAVEAVSAERENLTGGQVFDSFNQFGELRGENIDWALFDATGEVAVRRGLVGVDHEKHGKHETAGLSQGGREFISGG